MAKDGGAARVVYPLIIKGWLIMHLVLAIPPPPAVCFLARV